MSRRNVHPAFALAHGFVSSGAGLELHRVGLSRSRPAGPSPILNAMRPVFDLLRLLLYCYFLVLMGRLIIEWIQAFARDWRPKGLLLVVLEALYSLTDPPLRALRKVIPPLRLGGVALDLSFMVLLFAIWLLMALLP